MIIIFVDKRQKKESDHTKRWFRKHFTQSVGKITRVSEMLTTRQMTTRTFEVVATLY